MRVRIRDISPQGLTLHEPLPVDGLNERMNEGRHNDIVFTEDPRVEVHVERSPTGAETRGEVRARYRQPCSLCLREVERSTTARIDLHFQERPLGAHADEDARAEPEKYEDGVGISYFEGEHIELEPLLQEALILTLEPFWHPPCKANGRCSECDECPGATTPPPAEGKTSLGALLEQAAVKRKKKNSPARS